MNWLDIIIIVALISCAVGGLFVGLIRTVFSIVGLIVAILLAGRFYLTLAGTLTFIPTDGAAKVVAFIIIFLAVIIIAAVLGIVLTKIINLTLLGWVNRLLGAVLGFFLGAIFIAAILALWVRFGDPGDITSSSSLAQLLLDRLPFILGLLPEEFDSVSNFFQ